MTAMSSWLSGSALATRLQATFHRVWPVDQVQSIVVRRCAERGMVSPRILAGAFVVVSLVVGPILASCTGAASNEPSSASLTPAPTSQDGRPWEATPTPQESIPSPLPTLPQASATSEPAKSTPTASVAPTALPAGTWELTFERTGGFAGLAQRLTVDGQGQAISEDLRSGRLVEGRLLPEEMTELQRLLAESDFLSQDPSQSRDCSDCFNYGITLIRDSESRSVRANSLGLDSRLQPLVQWLAQLLGRGLNP